MIARIIVSLLLLATLVCCKSLAGEEDSPNSRQTRDVQDAIEAQGLLNQLNGETGDAVKRQYSGFRSPWFGSKRYAYFDPLANGLVGKRSDADSDESDSAMDKRYYLDNLTGLIGKRYYMMDSLADGLVGKRYHPMDSLASSLIGKRGYYSRYGSRDGMAWKRPFDSLASGLIGKRSAPNAPAE